MKNLRNAVFLIILSGCATAHDADGLGEGFKSENRQDPTRIFPHGKNHYKLHCFSGDEYCREKAIRRCEKEGTLLDRYEGGYYFLAHYDHRPDKNGESQDSFSYEIVDVYCKDTS